MWAYPYVYVIIEDTYTPPSFFLETLDIKGLREYVGPDRSNGPLTRNPEDYNMGPLVMLFILSLIIAVLYNFGAPRFYATKFGTKLGGSFFGATVATALVIFAAIWVASVAMDAVDGKPSLP